MRPLIHSAFIRIGYTLAFLGVLAIAMILADYADRDIGNSYTLNLRFDRIKEEVSRSSLSQEMQSLLLREYRGFLVKDEAITALVMTSMIAGAGAISLLLGCTMVLWARLGRIESQMLKSEKEKPNQALQPTTAAGRG